MDTIISMQDVSWSSEPTILKNVLGYQMSLQFDSKVTSILDMYMWV